MQRDPCLSPCNSQSSLAFERAAHRQQPQSPESRLKTCNRERKKQGSRIVEQENEHQTISERIVNRFLPDIRSLCVSFFTIHSNTAPQPPRIRQLRPSIGASAAGTSSPTSPPPRGQHLARRRRRRGDGETL